MTTKIPPELEELAFATGDVPTDRGWLPHEWVERAAIMEYDGGMTRREAERAASKDYQARVARRLTPPKP